MKAKDYMRNKARRASKYKEQLDRKSISEVFSVQMDEDVEDKKQREKQKGKSQKLL